MEIFQKRMCLSRYINGTTNVQRKREESQKSVCSKRRIQSNGSKREINRATLSIIQPLQLNDTTRR